jgi:hypothetical protein
MRDRFVRIGALLLVLSACDGSEREPQAKPAAAPEVDYKARIDRLSAAQRDALFLRAVRDAGHDCQQVVGSAFSGEHFGMPGWVARCGNGADWLIMLSKGGRALVARREAKPEAK